MQPGDTTASSAFRSLMKAITVCQPFAHLIVHGQKWVENREWPTKHRGPLLIHAGLSRTRLRGLVPTDDMAFGAIVGRVDLVDCLHIDSIEAGDHDARYPWLRAHEHTEGTWCLVLQNTTLFASPIPWKGALGLWNAPDALGLGSGLV